jgi:hypothetical protein
MTTRGMCVDVGMITVCERNSIKAREDHLDSGCGVDDDVSDVGDL